MSDETYARLTVVAASLCNIKHGADTWPYLSAWQQQMWRGTATKFLAELSAHEWGVVPMEALQHVR